MTKPIFPAAVFRLMGVGLVLALGGCGMKGPLRHPPPPPADAELTAPPSVTPSDVTPSDMAPSEVAPSDTPEAPAPTDPQS